MSKCGKEARSGGIIAKSAKYDQNTSRKSYICTAGAYEQRSCVHPKWKVLCLMHVTESCLYPYWPLPSGPKVIVLSSWSSTACDCMLQHFFNGVWGLSWQKTRFFSFYGNEAFPGVYQESKPKPYHTHLATCLHVRINFLPRPDILHGYVANRIWEDYGLHGYKDVLE